MSESNSVVVSVYHHFLLHDMFVSSAQSCDSGIGVVEPSPSLCSNRMNIKSCNGPYLHIVAARVINSLTGKSKLVYIQLDSGSQVSFVSHDLVRDLDLDARDKISINLIRELDDYY